MIRFRTAAIGGLLLSLLLNACSSGAGGMLPTAQHTGNMPSLIGGTTPQTTGRLPVAVNCPSIAAPGDSRIGIHSQPTQRLGGATVPNLVGGIALPERPGCGSGIARPKRTMAWSGCSSGQQDFGCNAHQSPGDGMVWVPEACAWLTGYQGQESCTPGFWESGCAAMGLPNNCGGGGSGYIPGAPCQPISSCVATVANNQQCYSAPVKNTPIGSGGHNNSISNVFVDSLDTNGSFTVIGYEYQTYGGQEFWQFAGQLSVGVSGGVSFVSVSAGASLNAPIVPYNGNLTTDLGESLNSMVDSGAMPFNAIGLLAKIISAAGSNLIVRADCYAG